MPALTLFDEFVRYNLDGTIDLDTHVFKAMLTDTTPLQASMTIKGDLTEIAAGNGYTAGGITITMTLAETGAGTGIWRWTTATPIAWTATGGNIATHRYLAIYDDTVASPVKPLVGYVDRGSSAVITTGSTRTWTVSAGLIDATRSP